MTRVHENDPQQEDRITPEITAYIRSLSPQQQVDVAAVLGHLAPSDKGCPPWCQNGSDEYPCRDDHFAHIGIPVNASRAPGDFVDPEQGEPLRLPMIQSTISWPALDRSGLTMSLFDRASDTEWQFEPGRFVDLMANMALAVRTVAEDGGGFFPGWQLDQLVEHIDAIRPQKRDAA